ncbi:hypothetical protein CLV92_102124 [Kineococcus xinjiangensis]|uniref:LemA protein n=1 Tax=Kineococcus xinjiangensis TaxID=512762 RepID=A0A2S6IUZ7_9ACTN|nr:hypothetical protein [Kineococcus xinjiangensis]PPK97973.1 hypothetical protein CLV92_102124 [Kineococcus xinjiangensis]
MGTTGIVVLVVVLLLVLALLAWGWTTRTALLRMRDLATTAGQQADRQRARRDELQTAAADDAGARRALADSQRRLDGDVAYHVAGVRAYNTRIAKAPASLVASVAGLHPLPEPSPRQAPAVLAEDTAAGEATGPRAAGATRAEPPRD